MYIKVKNSYIIAGNFELKLQSLKIYVAEGTN